MLKRSIAALVVIGSIAAGPAAAEPPSKKQSPAKKADKADKEAAPKTEAKPAAGSGSMAAQAESAAAGSTAREAEPGRVEARRLDLAPHRLFQGGALSSSSGDARGKEKRSGLGLGKDTDWRVQAAQVGVMVGVFGALVAACADGGCLLPELFGGRDQMGPPSDLKIRDSGTLRDAR
jgi:hypothetical protein